MDVGSSHVEIAVKMWGTSVYLACGSSKNGASWNECASSGCIEVGQIAPLPNTVSPELLQVALASQLLPSEGQARGQNCRKNFQVLDTVTPYSGTHAGLAKVGIFVVNVPSADFGLEETCSFLRCND